MADADPVLSLDELDERLRQARPPTPDDVSITRDGRRLDTKEEVLAFLAEMEAERAVGVNIEDLTERTPNPPATPLTSLVSWRCWSVTRSST